MGKFNQLLGVANNLADSFVSVSNIEFLRYIEHSTVKKAVLFEIDLLKETISPKELDSTLTKKTIQKYKLWFLRELKKLNIELIEAESVLIKIIYKPGKTFARYYACGITIRAKGKEYVKQVSTSYA